MAPLAAKAGLFIGRGNGIAVPGFNNGKSQINFNSLQTGGEFPFLNCLKTAQSWVWADFTGVPTSDKMSSDGYPTTIEHGGVTTVFYIPTEAERPGSYRLKWTGTGTIIGHTATNGNVTVAYPGEADGRVVFSITAGTNISDVSFVHVDDVAAYDSGSIWGVQFLAKLVAGNIGVLRFLNWMPYIGGNFTNQRYWADNKPVTYWSYQSDELRASIWGGTTGGTTTAYTCSAPSGWGGLVDKAIVNVKWNATAGSTTPTLNVGASGAKTIKGMGGDPLYNNGGGDTDTPTANYVSTLVFDSDLNAWLIMGGSLAFDNCWLRAGVPPSLMVNLCNTIKAHPWFVMPFYSCDPVTDYVTQLATYCRDNGPSWMIPRFETPNECWNSLFPQTDYANNKAIAEWSLGDNRFSEWVGKVASTMGQAVSAVYSNDRTKYQAVVGVQTVATPSDVDERLTSAVYVSHGGSAAFNWITTVCLANYYGPDLYGTGTETTLANEWLAGDATVKAARIATYVASCSTNLTAINARYVAWAAWGPGFGVNKLTGYEGGYSPDLVGNTSSTVNQFREASKASPLLNGFTTTNYTNFANAGGLFPSCFQMGGALNAWSVFDPDIWSTPSPQWTAIVAYNN